MIYLIDSNVILEVLLSQEKKATCKKFIEDNLDKIIVSDFTIYSIGILLFKFKREKLFQKFCNDFLPNIIVKSVGFENLKLLTEVSLETKLDFDDSYQYLIAKNNGLKIVTLDKHFKKVSDNIEVKFL